MIKLHKTPIYVRILNRMIIKENGYIGSILYSNRCGKFKILRYIGKDNNNDTYEIKFLHTNKKYLVEKSNIISGEVKDCMYPTIYGTACLGKRFVEFRKEDKEVYHSLIMRYYDIISRCYNKKRHGYERYGGAGVRVSDEWLNFSNFYYDITHMKDFDRTRYLSGELFIDKDKKQIDKPISERVYSKETVSLLTRQENNFYRDNMTMGEKHSKHFIQIHQDGTETIEKNVRKFARDHNISMKTVYNILSGETRPKDYNFRYPTEEELNMINSGKLNIGDILVK